MDQATCWDQHRHRKLQVAAAMSRMACAI